MLILCALTSLSVPIPTEAVVVDLELVEILNHELSVMSVACDAKGERVFTVDYVGVVRSWELDGTEPLWESAKHPLADPRLTKSGFELSIGEEVGARIGMSPLPTFDSIHLESGTLSQGMGASLGSSDMNDFDATKAVLVDPRDRWVWIGAERGVARLMAKGVSGWSQRGVANGGVTCLALDAKGNEIAIGGADGTIRFVGNKSCNVDKKTAFEGHGSAVIAAAWDPKGKLVASSSEASGILVHRRRGGKVDFELKCPKGDATKLAFDPKGKWLAAGTSKGAVVVWDAKKHEVIGTADLDLGSGDVHSLVVIDKGKTLIAATKKGVARIDLSALGK